MDVFHSYLLEMRFGTPHRGFFGTEAPLAFSQQTADKAILLTKLSSLAVRMQMECSANYIKAKAYYAFAVYLIIINFVLSTFSPLLAHACSSFIFTGLKKVVVFLRAFDALL